VSIPTHPAPSPEHCRPGFECQSVQALRTDFEAWKMPMQDMYGS